MMTEEELENCLESFERRCEIERNPETRKMWNVLRLFCRLVLGKQGHMYYPDYEIDTDFEKVREYDG